MVVLDKLLVKLRAENRKVVVFSQFTTVLDMIEDYLRWVIDPLTNSVPTLIHSRKIYRRLR